MLVAIYILCCSIHKSDEYQRGEVTLFASQWIHAVVVADGCDLVAIGPYVMGPSVIKDLDAAEHKSVIELLLRACYSW